MDGIFRVAILESGARGRASRTVESAAALEGKWSYFTCGHPNALDATRRQFAFDGFATAITSALRWFFRCSNPLATRGYSQAFANADNRDQYHGSVVPVSGRPFVLVTRFRVRRNLKLKAKIF